MGQRSAAPRHAPNCPRNGPGGSLVPGLEQCNKIARQNVLLGELLAITDNRKSLREQARDVVAQQRFEDGQNAKGG